MTFKKGDKPPTKGNEKGYAFLAALVDHQGDECAIWPMSRDKHGRGMVGHNGWHGWAHRLMCKLAHGEPPTPKHTAAHTCGKGHTGCVNPRHLAWKTQKENLADCVEHGTQGRHHYGPVGKLTLDQVAKIRELEPTHTQGQLAAMFGVAEGTINDIWRGRTWNRPHKINAWSSEEDAKLRTALAAGEPLSKAAEFVGRSYNAAHGRASRLGLIDRSS